MQDDTFDVGSRFATTGEVFSPRFQKINDIMSALNREFDLSDHQDVNEQCYPWSAKLYAQPQVYGSRYWEFPYAILSAGLEAGMTCADLGCGRTPFTIYLEREAHCDVTGFDPDVFDCGTRHKAFGVDEEFLRRTGLKVQKSGMDHLATEDSSFDRVFCLSDIEHVEEATARKGIQEMARVLKPGGRLIVTMDVEIFVTYCEADPFSLVWDSGLFPVGRLDLQWPRKRIGNGYTKGRPADVIGLVLEKRDTASNAII